jgi:hypothetical protein
MDETRDQSRIVQNNQELANSDSDEEPMLQGEEGGEKPRRRRVRKHTDIVIVDAVADEHDKDKTCCGTWTRDIKVVQQFREDTVPRWQKVLGVNSIAFYLFAFVSVMMCIDPILNTILVPGIILCGFITLRILSFVQKKIVHSTTLPAKGKYALLGLLGLGVLAG